MVPEQRVKTCTYRVCHMVKECHTKQVPYTVCHMRARETLQAVAYTVCKPVHYTKTVHVTKVCSEEGCLHSHALRAEGRLLSRFRCRSAAHRPAAAEAFYTDRVVTRVATKARRVFLSPEAVIVW